MLITLTGIDERLNRANLAEIVNHANNLDLQIEFAILYRHSQNNKQNSNRFPNPKELNRLLEEVTFLGIQSSIHICGFTALQSIANKDDETMKLINSFDRAQINFNASIAKYMLQLTGIKQAFTENLRSELIFTYSNNNKKLFDELLLDKEETSVLIDFSGGKGIEVNSNQMEISNKLRDFQRVGISGGLTPENIANKINQIKDFNPDWVDLESALRDEDDWFCTNKAIQFLSNITKAT